MRRKGAELTSTSRSGAGRRIHQQGKGGARAYTAARSSCEREGDQYRLWGVVAASNGAAVGGRRDEGCGDS